MTFKPGDPNMVCDICGFVKRRSQMRKNWKGQVVCADTCFETRHPQELVRSVVSRMAVRNARPEPPEVYAPEYPNQITADDL